MQIDPWLTAALVVAAWAFLRLIGGERERLSRELKKASAEAAVATPQLTPAPVAPTKARAA